MKITRETFLEQRHPRFGRANPERMEVPFWKMMVRGGRAAYFASKYYGETYDEHTGPVWCFDRFGMSRTELDDGRILFIAGEHEDFYDPDFCIYNDLIVRHPDGRIDIFGYPKDVFPPTDFHTATVAGDRVILIGSVGYPSERQFGRTPVRALSLSDFRITEIATTGTPPGWIGRHEARVDAAGQIAVSGGKVFDSENGKDTYRRNIEDFSLNLATGEWRKTTRRNWREFTLRPESRSKPRSSVRVTLEALRPTTLPHTLLPGAEWNEAALLVDGVVVSLTYELREFGIVVQTDRPSEVILRFLDEIRSRADALGEGRYVLEPL